ncbi:MAG: MaoC/PaaZ C-terminal domain-containing protein [Anaerolineae bacterium]|jgi:acyl dehydratase
MVERFVREGRYFEAFEIGDTAISAGRTITEADVVNFAGVAGDYTQIHTNAEFARGGPFGRRVAHGLLGLAVASGSLAQLGFIEGTVLASLPIYLGDTIHTEATVTGLKAMRRLGGGAVTFKVRVVNQKGKVVQRGEWVLLIASQPPG